MSYEFKKTEKVIDGKKYTITLEEGEVAYHIRIMKDGVTSEHYIQSKSKKTCMHHRNCGKEWGMLYVGEVMNTAHNLYEQFSARLLAM